METVVSIALVILVAALFAAMAVAPLVIAQSSERPARLPDLRTATPPDSFVIDDDVRPAA